MSDMWPKYAWGRLDSEVDVLVVDGRVFTTKLNWSSASGLAQLAACSSSEAFAALPKGREIGAVSTQEWACPWPRQGKVLALGRSYPAHAAELGNAELKEPLIFSKLPENAIGCGEPLVIPFAEGERFDNEIELAVVIGKTLHGASPEEASDSILGYTIVNDFTWRSEQGRAKAEGHPWHLAKNLAGALPIGPLIVPRFAFENPQERAISCRVNGVQVQDTSTAGMMWGLPRLLSWLSARQPLYPGDLVASGTPKGVTSVKPGDLVEASIDGLGLLSNPVVQGNVEVKA